MNIIVKFRDGMHEKIAIIDKKIEWSGSLNILSHNNRKEYMKRFEGEQTIKELFQKYNLEELLYRPNLNGEFCPECRKNGLTNFIRPKIFNGKSFYGCSGYPDCNFTASITIKTLDELGNRLKRAIPTPQRQTQNKTITNSKPIETTVDLFGHKQEGRQWESPKLHWSSIQLTGYKFSKKNNAWWKEK